MTVLGMKCKIILQKETGSVLGSTTEKVVTSNDLCSMQDGRLCDAILG